MKISRKSNTCLNCGFTLDKVYNYCPNCGQGNHDDNVSFGTLVGDFFSTYFAIDSKFAKTFRPFFFQPGFLTNKYVDGKRESYAHPIRLYLIISIFYFFTVTIAAKHLTKDDEQQEVKKELAGIRTLEGFDEETSEKIFDGLSRKQRKKLEKSLDSADRQEIMAFLNTLDSATQMKIRASVGDSTADSLALINNYTPKKKKIKSNNDGFQVTVDDDSEFILSKIDFDKIKKLDKEYNNEISNDQIYDSLNLGKLGFFEDLVAHQSIKITRANEDQVVSFIVKNLPLMMLFLIPLFGLVLKLLYIRKKGELYIKHLVHALHLHSFAYFLYGIFIIVSIYFITDEDYSFLANFITFIIVSVYAYISFKRVYKQHWFKTLIKFFLVGGVYFAFIIFFFVAEMVISLLLF